VSKSFYQADSPEEAIEIYVRQGDELYGRMKNRVIEAVLSEHFMQGSWESLKILEIGAGGGRWTDYFVRKNAGVTCVDICDQILEGNMRLHPQARFVLADATTVKVGDDFDFVFAKDVIEHIEDDEVFLENMGSHLKAGGTIMINTQNSCSLNYLIQGGYHYLRANKKWCGWDPTHVRFYNMRLLRKKITAAGFKPIRWFGSYYFPYRILEDRLCVRSDFKAFNIVELLKLFSIFPFSVTGWNIGVLAVKVH